MFVLRYLGDFIYFYCVIWATYRFSEIENVETCELFSLELNLICYFFFYYFRIFGALVYAILDDFERRLVIAILSD